MSVTASVTVGIAGPEAGLQLVYVKEDNLLPSEIEAAKESAENVAAGCNAVPEPKRSAAEEAAHKEALHHLDQHAWPYRKLRLYPPVNALLRCSYGNITPAHVVEEIVEEIVAFTGTDSMTFENQGDPISMQPLGRIYDETANEVFGLALANRGKGLVTADRRIWGFVKARYRTQYRVVNLAVVPTGESFEVQCLAYHGGEVAAAVAPFDLLEFDTGQVAGVDCGGIDGNPEPLVPPPPVARYELISLIYDEEVELGKAANISMVLRNINGVKGTGTAYFGLKYSSDRVTSTFSCDENAQVAVNMTLTPSKAGFFQTEARVLGDIFSTRNGVMRVTDPEGELVDEWTEISREMSDVNVSGVLVKRIETVTFTRGESGRKTKLVFDNTDVQ